MGVAATLAPKGLGPHNRTKKVAHSVDPLGQPISRKSIFNPPPPFKCIRVLVYFGKFLSGK